MLNPDSSWQAGRQAMRLSAVLLLMLLLLPSAAHGDAGFEEITLQQALKMAEDASNSLRRADWERVAARAETEAARARRRPMISSTVSSTYMLDPPDGVVLRRGSLGSSEAPGTTYPVPVPNQDVVLVPEPEHTYYRLNTVLEQPLFTWGKLSRGEAASRLGEQTAEADREQARRELARDTALSYYGVVFAGRTAALLRQTEDTARQMLEDRELAFEVGAVNRERLLETRTELQEIQLQRQKAVQAVRSAEYGLSVMLQQGVTAHQLVSDYNEIYRMTAVNQLQEQQLIQQAREHSTELKKLTLQRRQAEIAREIEQLSMPWRPDIALQLQLEASGQRLPGQANWHDSWDVGLNITLASSFDLYDGGRRRAAEDQAESRVEQLIYGAAELRDGIGYRVRSAVEQVENRSMQLELAESRRELAVERSKNAEVSFDNELITRTEKLGAEVLQLLAELELEQARYELRTALIELSHLSGLADY